MHPDYFLVLPWHFRAAIIERETSFRRRGGKLVFPLPVLDIVS
jgi:NDP-4-keto-2,6-dideoxyhexose 3-C-methyltransferase